MVRTKAISTGFPVAIMEKRTTTPCKRQGQVLPCEQSAEKKAAE